MCVFFTHPVDAGADASASDLCVGLAGVIADRTGLLSRLHAGAHYGWRGLKNFSLTYFIIQLMLSAYSF